MAVGKIYDSEETSRLSDFVEKKVANVASESQTKEAKEIKLVNYSMLLIGSIVVLLSIKLLIGKKK